MVRLPLTINSKVRRGVFLIHLVFDVRRRKDFTYDADIEKNYDERLIKLYQLQGM